jgi:hypothetical protein
VDFLSSSDFKLTSKHASALSLRPEGTQCRVSGSVVEPCDVADRGLRRAVTLRLRAMYRLPWRPNAAAG